MAKNTSLWYLSVVGHIQLLGNDVNFSWRFEL